MGLHGLVLGRPPRIQVEAQMSAVALPVQTELDHRWELRLEDFEDGHAIRRFECVQCGAVRFE